jgi:hypothetical protein
MGKWRYSSIFLDIGTRWRLVISFMPRPHYLRINRPGTHWIGDWVGPRVGLEVTSKCSRENNTIMTMRNLVLTLAGAWYSLNARLI